jgi:hypothetical protein
MSLRVLYFIFGLLSGIFYPLASQQGLYQMNLFKDNLSWVWLARLQFSNDNLGNHQFYFNNQFNSNLYLESLRNNKWRDDNNLHTFWGYQLQPSFRIRSHFKSHLFSDDNSFVKFSKNYIYQELSFRPRPEISLSPALGWASEEIFGFADQGWYSQMELDVNNLDIGGYDNSTRGFSSLFKFPNRNNREHRYFVAFQKQFSTRASDSIQVGYELVNNSYPLQPGPVGMRELEELGINTRYLYNNLNYQISGRSVFQVETKFQDRDFTQSNQNLHNHRQELNFANRISYRFSSSKFLTAFSFVTSQNTNLSSRRPSGSIESRTDIDGLQSAINLLTNWRISPKDAAQLSFSYTKYEYSSPDTTQTIDEDDIRFIVDMSYQHKFSRYFSTRLYTNLYFYHQIYIHPSRSINNNWNRIFQLAASFDHYIPEIFRHKYRIEILANYTVYDFEELLPEPRSYLFRKLVFTDTLRVGLTRGLQLQTIYQLEKEDNGTFFKDIFAQQISRELLSHLIDIGLIYFRIKGFELTTAFNWYIRKEWSFSPDQILIRDYISFSPRISLLYNLSRRLNLFVSLAPRTYQNLNIDRQYFTMGRINLRYFF